MARYKYPWWGARQDFPDFDHEPAKRIITDPGETYAADRLIDRQKLAALWWRLEELTLRFDYSVSANSGSGLAELTDLVDVKIGFDDSPQIYPRTISLLSGADFDLFDEAGAGFWGVSAVLQTDNITEAFESLEEYREAEGGQIGWSWKGNDSVSDPGVTAWIELQAFSPFGDIGLRVFIDPEFAADGAEGEFGTRVPFAAYDLPLLFSTFGDHNPVEVTSGRANVTSVDLACYLNVSVPDFTLRPLTIDGAPPPE